MKRNYRIIGIVFLFLFLGIIFTYCKKDSVKIENKVRSLGTSFGTISDLEGNEELYGVCPTENYQFGLYISRIEIDQQIEAALKVITVKHLNEPEEIMRAWIEVTPEKVREYQIETQIIDDKVNEEGDVICVGKVLVTGEDGTAFSTNVIYAGQSVF